MNKIDRLLTYGMKAIAIMIGLFCGAVVGIAIVAVASIALGASFQAMHPDDPSAGSVAIIGILLIPIGALAGAALGAVGRSPASAPVLRNGPADRRFVGNLRGEAIENLLCGCESCDECDSGPPRKRPGTQNQIARNGPSLAASGYKL